MIQHIVTKGKLILAGAGPGDPELISVKAARYLGEADVILADRLVSEEIVKRYVPEGTEIIHVGKQCRRGLSTPQQIINELIITHCLAGKLVVRLKGGDVSIFSNILDELSTATTHGIPYEIIPGVTAALGAAAYGGFPLTARGYATAARLLTYYKSDVVTEAYWEELAKTDDTLVFYMSSETIETVAEKLTFYHIHEEKLLAVIEQATTPMQTVSIFNLYDAKKQLKGRSFISPSIIIIGKVVALHEQFAWVPNSGSRGAYFAPVSRQPAKNYHPETM